MQHPEDEEGVWTHAYECASTKRIWYVTLIGTFLKTEHQAKQLIAEQVYKLELQMRRGIDVEGLTVERCKNWLQGLHHLQPGNVTMVSTSSKSQKPIDAESGKLRSQVLA
jgi:hypothetical protein